MRHPASFPQSERKMVREKGRRHEQASVGLDGGDGVRPGGWHRDAVACDHRNRPCHVAKAGLIVGAGGGRGTLSFRHRLYPFTVQGLSLGLTAGASINRLVGRADYINKLEDFAGTYSVVGTGGALVGGVGGVQLRNGKGVVINLQGAKGGIEVSANITKVVITLDQTRSTPD